MGDLTKIILALMLILAIINAAEGTDCTRTVPASEVLTQVEAGIPVEYDHVIIIGNLSLNRTHLSAASIKREPDQSICGGVSSNLTLVNSFLRINDSRLKGQVDMNNSEFMNIVDFSNTVFNNSVNFRGCVFRRATNFSRVYFKDSDFNVVQFNETANFDRQITRGR